MTITVQCPSCSTSFPVDPAKVPEKGVHARCSHCSGVFFVAKPPQIEDAGPEPTPGEVRAPAFPEPPDGGAEETREDEGTEEAWDDGGGETREDEWIAPGDASGEDEWIAPGEPSQDEVGAFADEGAVEEGAPAPADEADDWVFERDPELDPSTLDVEPMETVENSPGGFIGEPGGAAATEEAGEPGEAVAPEEEAFFLGGDGPAPAVEEEEADEAPTPPPLPEEGHVPDTVPEPTTAPAGFQFGRRDPHEKAQRLARVLVSDMIMYNPERHTRALEEDSLAQDFGDEIKKSWDEFVDQVGDDIARSTTYFSDALNEILAKGREIFQGSPPAL